MGHCCKGSWSLGKESCPHSITNTKYLNLNLDSTFRWRRMSMISDPSFFKRTFLRGFRILCHYYTNCIDTIKKMERINRFTNRSDSQTVASSKANLFIFTLICECLSLSLSVLHIMHEADVHLGFRPAIRCIITSLYPSIIPDMWYTQGKRTFTRLIKYFKLAN